MSTIATFLHSPAARPPLKLALLVTSDAVLLYGEQLLEALDRCNYCQVVAVIRVPPRAPRLSWLYRLYRWLDRQLHPSIVSHLGPRDAAHILGAFPAVHPVADAIQGLDLDAIISLGEPADLLSIAEHARCGVWRLKLGDTFLWDDGSRHFMDGLRRHLPLKVTLTATVAGHTSPMTLACATLSSLSNVWVTMNLPASSLAALDMTMSTLWHLHTGGWNQVLQSAPGDRSPCGEDDSSPGSLKTLRLLANALTYQFAHRVREHRVESRWLIAMRRSSGAPGLASALEVRGYSWITAPPGHYYADPFPFVHEGREFIFVEDIDGATNKGTLSCLEVFPDGSLSPPREILQMPWHLSYPCVFEHDGEVFMIPESGTNHTVELFRAVEFPWRWEPVKVLFRGPAFDCTMLQHEGLFWFFVTLVDLRHEQSTQLMLYYADSLTGDWKPHPQSPVSLDIRYSRCAGKPFRDGAHWIRPSQDGSRTYGGAIQLRRIVELSTSRYREEPAGTLDPGQFPGFTGVHTYNRAGSLEVIDGKRRVRQQRRPHAAAA